MKNKFLTLQDMTLGAVFAIVIAICSFIQLPFGPIPFTLQTFGVCITAGILGLKRGTLSIIIYIILGIIGLPVFRGAGGIGVLVGPTGGFIMGFIVTAIIIGLVSDKTRNNRNRVIYIFVSTLLGDLICLLIGCVQYMIVANVNFIVAFIYCVAPFIITDIIKIILSTIVILRVRTFS